MIYAIYAVTALYALLSITAAFVQIKKENKKITPCMMICGGGIVILSVILHILHFSLSWITALVGGLLICAAAYINGKKGEKFHPVHHIVRLVFTAMLTIGFIFF